MGTPKPDTTTVREQMLGGFHTTPKGVMGRLTTLLLGVFALLSALLVALKTWVRAVQEDRQQV